MPDLTGFDRRSCLLVRTLAVAGCLAIVLGAKFWLVADFRAVMPVWDEWAEAELYRAYLDGTLGFADLIRPHNEHRIFVPRLVLLITFASAGRWDLMFSAMIGNAIHIAALGCLLTMLNRALGMAGMLLLALVAAPMLAIPFAFDNVLSGFQAQFYEVILFSVLSLWLLSLNAAWTLRWWLGTLLGVLSYFCMASGALTLPAAIACAAVQLAVGRRSGRGELLAMLTHGLIAAVMFWDLPRNASLGVSSLDKALEAFSIAASWPISKSSWPAPAHWLVALAIYAPVILLSMRLIREAARLDDVRWFQPALAGWVVLQVLALIYGRTNALVPRYMDLMMIGLLVNAAALFHLVFVTRERLHAVAAVAAGVWLIAVITGLSQKAIDDVPAGLAWKRETTEIQTRNFLQFLASGDFSALDNKPMFHIPFSEAEPLRRWASDPAMRSLLPAALFGKPESKLKILLMKIGRYLMPIGFALIIIAGMFAALRSTGRAAPSAST